MDEDRVKDPLGQYEKNMPIFRDAKPGDGWKAAANVVYVIALLAVVSFLLRRLIG